MTPQESAALIEKPHRVTSERRDCLLIPKAEGRRWNELAVPVLSRSSQVQSPRYSDFSNEQYVRSKETSEPEKLKQHLAAVAKPPEQLRQAVSRPLKRLGGSTGTMGPTAFLISFRKQGQAHLIELIALPISPSVYQSNLNEVVPVIHDEPSSNLPSQQHVLKPSVNPNDTVNR